MTKKKEADKPQGQAPGRGSIMWDTLTDLAHLPLMLPIATMQSALPAVGTAVNKYGIYKSDPQGRGRRTNWSMIRFLYDGGDFAHNESHNLRALHAHIKGVNPDGSKYHALSPKTFRIVPDTFLDAVIRIRQDMGKPLSPVEERQVYQEYVGLCLLLGIPQKDIEPTLQDFYRYYEDLIRHTMTYNETVQFLTATGIEHAARLQRFKRLQPLADEFHRRYVYPTLHLCAIRCLHPLYRERFNLPWSDHDEARYQKLLRRLRRFTQLVPRPLRYNPVAYLVMLGFHGPGLVSLQELDQIEQKKQRRQQEKEKLAAEN